jgi:hypothetical protein
MTKEEQLKELNDAFDKATESSAKYLFVLDGKEVVPCKKLRDWSDLLLNPKARTVALTETDDYKVSTVFVGCQGFDNDEEGRPCVFETMIFGGEYDNYCEKYSTWEAAEKGHEEALRMIKEEKDIK